MAFPLKSGADLYNQQLIRAAIWNYSAEILDPKEYVTGLIYFNTNPGSNLYQKLRFRTGTEWKTIAFEEDLDVANNADFQKLKDKVDLLSGEVDTDAIISNMKEVSNFLAGFAEDAKLMSVLDGKLDKSGGTIKNNTYVPLKVVGTSVRTSIGFSKDASAFAYLTYNGGSSWAVTNEYYNNEYTLIHSGNANKTDVPWAASNILFPTGTSATWNIHSINGYKGITVLNAVQAKPEGAPDHYAVGLSVSGYYGFTLASLGGGDVLLYRKDSGDWKTIAFTDSNVASAQAVLTSDNKYLVQFNANTLYVGGGTYDANQTHILGKEVQLRYGASGTIGLLLNTSGNVTIGSEDKAGKSAKLYVGGRAVATGGFYIADSSDSYEAVQLNPAYGLYIGYGTSGKYNTLLWGQNITFVTGANGQTRLYIANGGNVLIGATEDKGQKLQVNGDIVASGTIACKGIAAEGDAMDMVDKTVLHIPSSTTQQTFTLNHGLGTREITVSIYEITSMGTNMILTDVEIVDDNNISVSFGNPPSEEHMVVVMG